MRRASKLLVVLALAALAPAAAAQSPAQLQIHVIDVEGGQATLFVLPSGESLLVDTGWAGFNGRDADRIAAAAKRHGVTRIDTLVVTHYHADHVGGVPQIVERLPVRRFVDHGPTVETGDQPTALFTAYTAVRDKAEHVVAKPGDTLKVGDLELRIVSAGGDLLTKALPGAGQANALCADYKPKDADATENARSVGMVLSYGSFRMLDLGDLTWNKEHDLVCPNNLIGTVDVYLTTHHGMAISGLPALVQAVRPRVAIMNNGARKGGTAEAWNVVKGSPGLEDLWQIHTAVAADALNVAVDYIANLDDTTGNELTIAADRDGSFSVINPRNGQSKQYRR
jgi:competence protein ComEC